MITTRARRVASLTALLLLVPTTLVGGLVGPVAPALADDGCVSEAASGIGSARCDDTNPPDTMLVSADPTVNRNGYLRSSAVTISFAGDYTDADQDPITFECQFYEADTAPSTWNACTSPVSYTDLADTDDVPYTFRVRAIDSADAAINATSGGFLGVNPTGAATDLPDYDQTPAAASFFVDTVAPNTFVFDEPYDDITPDHPMVTSQDITLDLESTEADATFVCTLSGVVTPCTGGGPTTFTKLAPGNQELDVYSVDPAGNVDLTPTSTPFSVPRNLTAKAGSGWTQVQAKGFFAGNVLVSTTTGTTLVVNAKKAKEVRVLAPKVKGLGTISVRFGRHQWIPLNQVKSTPTAIGVVYQQFFGRAFTGPISFEVTKANAKKPALLDAILLH